MWTSHSPRRQRTALWFQVLQAPSCSHIQKLPIKFNMPEKGEVAIGHFTGKVASGKMHGRGEIKLVTNSFG